MAIEIVTNGTIAPVAVITFKYNSCPLNVDISESVTMNFKFGELNKNWNIPEPSAVA